MKTKSSFTPREPEEFREQCAAKLLTLVERRAGCMHLSGWMDSLTKSSTWWTSATMRRTTIGFPTIQRLGERVTGAAGKSTNIEMVVQRTKLGGNGPIMANALARLGIKVTYVGALGYPVMHPVFNEFARHAEVHSIAEPGRTDALEFEDGKVMLVKSVQLNEITWHSIQARFGRDKFIEKFSTADLVAFVNWTMIPYMSDLWASLLSEFCPNPRVVRRKIFFDLADPEKRTPKDISRALELITGFEKFFDVVLGLNEKEAYEVGNVLGLNTKVRSAEGLQVLARDIQRQVPSARWWFIPSPTPWR